MLHKVEVKNYRGDLLGLVLDDVTDGYALVDVGGLGPVKAVLVSSSFANLPGAQYHSSRRETRNLTMRIELIPDYVTSDVQSLREHLYMFFMPQSEVNFQMHDTKGSIVKISGRVESCEPAIFTTEPAVDISIMCFDPDFLALTEVELSGTTTSGISETNIAYAGHVSTGIQLVLNVNRTLSEFTIYHKPPDGTIRSLDFSYPLLSGDVLTLRTIRANKGALLNRASTDTSVLYGISPQSDWIELLPGNNLIRVYAEGAAIPYDLVYVNRYGGL